MAEDLHEFILDHEIQNPIIMGHSMGGKTVMKFSFKYPDVFKKMIVVTDFMPIPLLALSKHLHFQLIHDIRNFTKFKRVDLFSFGKKIQKRHWKECENIITVSDFTK